MIGQTVKLLLVLIGILVGVCDGYGSCFKPNNLHRSDATTSSLDIAWNDFSSEATGYDIIWTTTAPPDFDQFTFTPEKYFSISNLTPGTAYHVFVRTVCGDSKTDWIQGTFTTVLSNAFNCQLHLPIPDNGCPQHTTFELEVSNISGNLGQDAFISKLNLTIDHDWPADLRISLENPQGDVIVLMENRGIGMHDIGIVSDSCTQPMSFTHAACESISDPGIPLQGTRAPEQNFDLLYNQSSPNGIWKLHVCDDAADQKGFLEQFYIDFEPVQCIGPEALYFTDITESSVQLNIPNSDCDSLHIWYELPNNGQIIDLYIPCGSQSLYIPNLIPNETYAFNYSFTCGNSTIESTCPGIITTSCSSATLFEDFDQQNICTFNCGTTCFLSNTFLTNTTERSWSILTDPTPTNFTGPKSDVRAFGKYIYAEASSSTCDTTPSILLTQCIEIDSSKACDLSFYYHMFGASSDSLSLELSTSNGNTWTEIWQQSGSQSIHWQLAQVDLSMFHGLSGQFRFLAYSRNGEYGDIALDEIRFHGSTLIPNGGFVYYKDEDNDGYGSLIDSILYCGKATPPGYSIVSGDCDDSDFNIHPNAFESPCNLIDDNCNGQIDETNDNNTLTFAIDSIRDEQCDGLNNGYVALSASNGIPPFTFTWEDGVESAIRSDLAAGQYVVEIEDSGNCKIQTDTISIDVMFGFPGFFFVFDSVQCYGDYTGSIEIIPNQANAPYTYIWSTGDTLAKLDQVTSGKYYATLTDKNGCVLEHVQFTVPSKTEINIALDTVIIPNCSNDSTGQIQITASGGFAPYIYQWSNGQTAEDISNLSSNFYKLTVQDTFGCMAIDSVWVPNPKPISYSVVQKQNVTCYGYDNGSLSIVLQGGSPPYTIAWNNLDTTTSIKNLLAGNYSFIAHDSKGCMLQSDTIVISQSSPITVDSIYTRPTICSAKNLGMLHVFASGGTNTFQYFWQDNNDSKAYRTGLDSGYYHVTIVDELNCKLSQDSIYVGHKTVSLGPINTQVIQEISCYNGADGRIIAQLDTHAVLPITWALDTLESSTNLYQQTFQNIGSDSIVLLAIDSRGCQSDPSLIQLSDPEPIQIASFEKSNPGCLGGADGWIKVSPTGGTPPYSILWSNSSTSFLNEGLNSGVYSATIQDSKKCSFVMEPTQLISPDSLWVQIDSIKHVTCFGQKDGLIRMSPTGGTPPYFIDWDENLTGFNPVNLSAGVYHFEFRDSSSCPIYRDSIVITEPAPVHVSADSVFHEVCSNKAGYISVNMEGGNGPYSWTLNDEYQSNAFAKDLGADDYLIHAFDKNNCQSNLEIVSIKNTNLPVHLQVESIQHASCKGSKNGLLTFSASSNLQGPFIWYFDNKKDTTEVPSITYSNLIAGSYSIKVQDQQACIDSIPDITIDSPKAISFAFDTIHWNTCHNTNDGFLVISGQGGTPPFNYLWNHGKETALLDSFSKPSYKCTIIDKNNCQFTTDSIRIFYPDSLEVEAKIEHTYQDQAVGSIALTVTGGLAPYTFKWDSPLNNETSATVENLSSGIYEVFIKDSLGCTRYPAFKIEELVRTSNSFLNPIQVYPNPTNGYIKIHFGTNPLPSSIGLYSASGHVINTWQENIASTWQVSLSHLPTGIYILELTFDAYTQHYKIVLTK